MKTYNDKIIGKNIIVLIVLCLVSSCVDLMTPENNDISSEEIETVEDEINYVDGVLLYGSEMGDYVQILDENTIHLFKDAPKDKFPQVDDIIVYNPGETVTDVFIGRVVSILDEGDKWVIKTQTPSMEDVFEDLSINMEMGVHNTTAIYHASEGDNITSCRVVDNSVWDNITVLYDSANSIREFSSTKASAYNPVDVTVELAVNSKAFEGKIYIRTQGYVYMKNLNDFVMNVSTQIGLNGTLGVGSEGGCEIPLMQAKKGITLCTNKVLALKLKLKPQLLFLTEGKIRVESALNFEFVNTDIKMSHNKTEGFKNNSIENKHDNYFRLESLHSEGKFGLALNGDLYAVLLNESFFKGGAHLRTGLTLGGEKNVGIQFPGYANFDFMVLAEPFVSMQPFVAHMSAGGLNILKGPEFNASLELFKISLLPDINKVQYESVGEAKLGVNAQVKGSKTSLIVSKQEGIALFKKGEENPDMRGRIMEISSKAQGDGTLFFDLEEGHEYEIAVYVESEKDGFIYGERIPIEKSIREVLEEFYRSTDGENWLRNDNWCTDAPLYEWYGVSPLHDQEKDVTYYRLYLSGNNLTGNAYIGPNDKLTFLELYGNNMEGIQVSGCEVLNEIRCSENPAKHLNVSNCPNMTRLNIANCPWEVVNIKGCYSLEDFYMGCRDDIHITEPCSLNISDCTNLNRISCTDAGLSEFNISCIPSLVDLDLNSNMLETLNLKNCINLEEINVRGNPLVSVDLSGCISLRYFDFKAEENKTLETLDFSGCSNLESINVEVNTVSLIDVSGCSKLLGIECGGGLSSTLTIIGDAAFTGGVYCWDGNLTSLDVSSCSGLTWLNCSENKLTSLNLSGNTGLISLGCWENKLTSLDVSGCSSLKSLDCSKNPLTSLNVSGCTALKRLHCTDTHLNMCITDMYQKLEEFYYDQKYTNYYRTGYNNQTLHYTTNQYGWWYPGEPARGYH